RRANGELVLSALRHSGTDKPFVEFFARGDDDRVVVRGSAFASFDDGNCVNRVRKQAIELGENARGRYQIVGEGAGADQVKPVKPEVRARFDRPAQPGDSLLVLLDKEIGAAE